MKAPKVSAILPVSSPSRINLARKVANNFISQMYTPFELIISNGTGEDSVLNTNNLDKALCSTLGISIKEIFVSEGGNAAKLRNAGIEEAEGDWIFPIDDDDWFHPLRLTYQMAHRVENHPCLLACQFLVDLSFIGELDLEDKKKPQNLNPNVRLKFSENGIFSTILFPRKNVNGSLWLYDESLNLNENEDLIFRMTKEGFTPVVCNNFNNPVTAGLGSPLMSIAFFHTENELTKEAFFGPKEVTSSIPKSLTVNDIDLVKKVLQEYNFNVS